ncbi:MAG: HlyC/CorC family transporter [Kiritimatiellae bacterium]|nr:HlyC/CorC family transporter [Kiritimatiellia bacterium]
MHVAAYTLSLSILLILLFCLSAFFSASETAFFSLTPIQIGRIKRRNRKTGRRLDRLLKDPALLLSTLLVGNNLANFTLAAIGYLLLDRVWPGRGELIGIPAITFLLLIFGEITPKRLAILHTEFIATHAVRLLQFFRFLLFPLSILMKKATQTKVFRKALIRERQNLSDDELLTVLETGQETGVLDAEEVSMVNGIIRLADLMASDEMIPRIDIVGLDLDLPRSQWLEIVRRAKHRYLPIFRRTPDAIEGCLDAVLFLMNPIHNLEKASFSPLFVPENMPLDTLLLEFQAQACPIACVLDEYGGTAGIITRGDILELISAPVVTASHTTPQIYAVNEKTWIMDGTTSLEEINQVTDLELTADDSDRISGWITFHAKAIPSSGLEIEAQGCRVTVLEMRKRRITRVRLMITQDTEPPETDALPKGQDELLPSEEENPPQ